MNTNSLVGVGVGLAVVGATVYVLSKVVKATSTATNKTKGCKWF